MAAQSLGLDILGFHPNQIGLHSARSGATMAMFFAGVPVFTIMLLGRGSSDAFMRYIRKQVLEFSLGRSFKMFQNKEFFTVLFSSSDKSRIQSHPFHTASQNTNGISFQGCYQTIDWSLSIDQIHI